jgi:CBS domain-containing protein
MSAPVRTVSASESLMAADELLRGYRISSLVVIDGGQPVGVLARSDLLDELIDDPASPLPVRGGDTDIASRMTRNAIHVDAAAPLIAGCRLLLEAEVHQLVVVEKQMPVGILSRRDAVAAVRDLALEGPLIDAATPIAFTISADQSVREAQRFLEHAELTTVIVTDGHFPVGVFGPREQLLARELPRDASVEWAMNPALLVLPADLPLHRAAAHFVATRAALVVVLRDGIQSGVLTATDFCCALAAL